MLSFMFTVILASFLALPFGLSMWVLVKVFGALLGTTCKMAKKIGEELSWKK